jgi:CRP-like cAMP-binding protein
MPKLDGFGVIQIFSEDDTLKDKPFIFLTAKTNHEDVRKGMNLGADDFITKPFDESELLSSVATRLKKANKFNGNTTGSSNVHYETKKIWDFKNIKDIIKLFYEKPEHLYHKGESLFCEGNKSNHIFLVKSGEVKTFKTTEYGKELITGLYGEERFLGYSSILGDFPHTENAEAVQDSKVIKIDKSEIITLIKSNPNLALNLIELLSKNIKITKEKLVQIAYDSVRGRTAKSLLLLLAENPKKQIEISRSNLACLTGIAKETLIRTLTDFKEEGLIETTRDFVKVINEKELNRVQ